MSRFILFILFGGFRQVDSISRSISIKIPREKIAIRTMLFSKEPFNYPPFMKTVDTFIYVSPSLSQTLRKEDPNSRHIGGCIIATSFAVQSVVKAKAPVAAPSCRLSGDYFYSSVKTTFDAQYARIRNELANKHACTYACLHFTVKLAEMC